MNAMVYEDLENPYCRMKGGGFFDWKDIEAERELSAILFKCQQGILEDFSEEWGDDYLPRLRGVSISREDDAMVSQTTNESTQPLDSANLRLNRTSLRNSKLSRFSSPQETNATLKESLFGGFEFEIIQESGTYEELLWIDQLVPEEILINKDDVDMEENSDNYASILLEECVEKHFKSGFLPIEPDLSIRMEILCTLVDRVWDSIYPTIATLVPVCKIFFGGTKGRAPSPDSQILGMDSPHASEHSLNSSFNEDDFSTSTSHSDLHRIMYHNENDSVDAMNDSTEEQGIFIQLKPEGDGQKQGIGLGLNQSIRIRPYTTGNALGRNETKSFQRKKHIPKSKQIANRNQEYLSSVNLIGPVSSGYIADLRTTAVKKSKKILLKKKIQPLGISKKSSLRTKRNAVVSKSKMSVTIPSFGSALLNHQGLVNTNVVGTGSKLNNRPLNSNYNNTLNNPNVIPSNMNLDSNSTINNYNTIQNVNQNTNLNTTLGTSQSMLNVSSTTVVNSIPSSRSDRQKQIEGTNLIPTTIIGTQLPQVSLHKSTNSLRPSNVNLRSNDVSRFTRHHLQSSNAARLPLQSTTVSRQQLQTSGGFRVSRPSTRAHHARENNGREISNTVSGLSAELNSLGILPQISVTPGIISRRNQGLKFKHAEQM